MKKWVMVLLLGTLMFCLVFTGCGDEEETESTDTGTKSEAVTTVTDTGSSSGTMVSDSTFKALQDNYEILVSNYNSVKSMYESGSIDDATGDIKKALDASADA